MALANRCWESTLREVIGAAPGDNLTDKQLSELTQFIIPQFVNSYLPPLPETATPPARPVHPMDLFVPKKRRGSPAKISNVEATGPTHQLKQQKSLSVVAHQKIKKIHNKRIQPLPPPQEEAAACPLPAAFRDVMTRMGLGDEGTITFLIQKNLTSSDVNWNLGRLMISLRKMNAAALGFLTAEEKRQVGGKMGMSVQVIEPSCEAVCELRLRLWPMGNNDYYALIGGWHDLVARNRIRAGNTLQVWSFRVGSDSKLCIAVVKV